MTNERVRANNATRTLERVSTWENSEVDGKALCADLIYQQHVEKVEDLRGRQEAYLDSLPKDMESAIRAAFQLLHPDGRSYPEGIEEALHLSWALCSMVKEGNLDEEGCDRDAAIYIADRVAYSLHIATRRLDRIADTLRSPRRVRSGD